MFELYEHHCILRSESCKACILQTLGKVVKLNVSSNSRIEKSVDEKRQHNKDQVKPTAIRHGIGAIYSIDEVTA